ncbi:S-methyl-5-thioribose-1-phosphate isomerase [Patescibacteria group bacterium]|nr:S-methyl-5-thioribose-1-phosphate isomerase [Patescibacteria group bacterium]MBU4511709.1 S-methyl-5-thioribose-1-phosphate isomerase [Patescibacteria group bacterium]MCG2692956.1 S-methyl-5-thioribose-1-phosphate isomerase [Candidatus Parcubacteria bacterium]
MSLQKTIQDIQTLKIQGATAVAQATLLGLKKCAKKMKSATPSKFIKEAEKCGKALAYARPTEPMAQNLVELVISKLKKSAQVGADNKHLQEILEYLVNHELREMEEDLKQVVEEGVKLIKNKDKILTFCHSSTVEKILIEAKSQGKKFKVYVPETRPLFQGRITAKNLSQAKIDVTMIVDSLTDKLLVQKQVNKVLIGADVILGDGSIINKVGSFGICEDAHQNKIPVYVAAVLLKKQKGKLKVKIEKRQPREVWEKQFKNITIKNPAFDKVPAKYITGIVTERGVLKPGEVKEPFS